MRFVYATLLVFTVFACKEKDKKPADLLSLQATQRIYWDLLVADQFAVQKGGSADSIRLAKKQLYENVFAENKVSPRQYQTSFTYYMADPTTFKMLYDTLSEKANRQRFQPKPLKMKD